MNYLLLRRGSSIEDVERVIGPFNGPQEDVITAGTRPTNEKGVFRCMWEKIPSGNRITITFVDGRATEFEYFAPMP